MVLYTTWRWEQRWWELSFRTGSITSALLDWGSQLHSKTRTTSSAKRRAVVKMWEKLLELVCKKHVPVPPHTATPTLRGFMYIPGAVWGEEKQLNKQRKEKNSIFNYFSLMFKSQKYEFFFLPSFFPLFSSLLSLFVLGDEFSLRSCVSLRVK